MKRAALSKTWLVMALVSCTLVMLWAAGCSTGRGTGAAAGAGVGALIGQAVGRNTTSTLIGAAIGTGAGYIIGNEMVDKKKTSQPKASTAKKSETGNLGGTKWKAVSMVPMTKPPYKSYEIYFGRDGFMESTQSFADGSVKRDKEHYRVVGDTLIINDPGYLINAKYSVSGKQLVVSAEKFRAVFTRIN